MAGNTPRALLHVRLLPVGPSSIILLSSAKPWSHQEIRGRYWTAGQGPLWYRASCSRAAPISNMGTSNRHKRPPLSSLTTGGLLECARVIAIGDMAMPIVVAVRMQLPLTPGHPQPFGGFFWRQFLRDSCPRRPVDCDAVCATCSYTALAAFLNRRAERLICLNGSVRLPANGGIRIVDRCLAAVKLSFRFWTLKCYGCRSVSAHRFELAEGSFPV